MYNYIYTHIIGLDYGKVLNGSSQNSVLQLMDGERSLWDEKSLRIAAMTEEYTPDLPFYSIIG